MARLLPPDQATTLGQPPLVDNPWRKVVQKTSNDDGMEDVRWKTSSVTSYGLAPGDVVWWSGRLFGAAAGLGFVSDNDCYRT